MPKKVLFTGSRHWNDVDKIENWLQCLPQDTIVIHGDCPTRADAIVDELATQIGLTVRRYPANWKKHGRKAGPLRNIEMLETEDPDFVVGFPLGESKGTYHMMNIALNAGKPVYNGSEAAKESYHLFNR